VNIAISHNTVKKTDYLGYISVADSMEFKHNGIFLCYSLNAVAFGANSKGYLVNNTKLDITLYGLIQRYRFWYHSICATSHWWIHNTKLHVIFHCFKDTMQ